MYEFYDILKYLSKINLKSFLSLRKTTEIIKKLLVVSILSKKFNFILRKWVRK